MTASGRRLHPCRRFPLFKFFGDIVDFWQLQTRIRDLISSVQEEENNNERERTLEQKEAESGRRGTESFLGGVIIFVLWFCGTDCGGVGHGAAVRGGRGDGGGGRRRGGGSSYCQILRGEAAQARQAPPGGGTVELLHLLRQLLLQTPLLLVLLRVGELHHNGRRAALRKKKETETEKKVTSLKENP